MKQTKNNKKMLADIELHRTYELSEAIKIIKEKSYAKFNETIDVAIKLGIDTNKSDQNIKGVVNLPNGTGKSVTVAVVASEEDQKKASEEGADIVGESELIDKISSGEINFDILISSPELMPKLGKVAKILGPKGLMPNPKLGTVSKDIKNAVKNVKSGQVKFKNDKSGIVHAGFGKIDFKDDDLITNLKELYSTILKNKPDSMKGSFIKKVTIASTMGFGLKINVASLR